MQTLFFSSEQEWKHCQNLQVSFVCIWLDLKSMLTSLNCLSPLRIILELILLPPTLLILCFSVWFSLSVVLSLLEPLFVSHFNPIHISKLYSTWVPWHQLCISAWNRVREADENSMLNKSWVSVCNFEIFCKFGRWEIKARIFPFLHIIFLWNALSHAHLGLVIWEGR